MENTQHIPDLTYAQVYERTEENRAYERRCREQFERTARTALMRMPANQRMIFFDPGNTTGLENGYEHGLEGGDLHSLTLDAEGKLQYGIETETGLISGLYPADDGIHDYGIYMIDWTWALRALMENLQCPYIPPQKR